jgi:hypothetical protein
VTLTDILKDRRAVAIGGAGLALVAGLGIATVVALRQGEEEAAPPPASEGGLVIKTGREDDIRLDPARPLRCFVSDKFIGELPVAECAHRNGVATGALDVGLDTSGALSAAKAPSTEIVPLPPSVPVPDQTTASDEPAAPQTEQAAAPAPAGGGQACWRYGGGNWHRLPYAMSLDACVAELFAGQCVRAGAAVYGRWGDRTLRLAYGRIEQSANNRDFRTLANQGPGCAAPPIG